MKDKPSIKLTENAVALSAQFHNAQHRYDQFYDRHGAALSGFPGIWNYVAKAAEVFTDEEARAAAWFEEWEDWNGEWIEAVGAYAQFLLYQQPLPSAKEQRAFLRKLARKVSKGISVNAMPIPDLTASPK